MLFKWAIIPWVNTMLRGNGTSLINQGCVNTLVGGSITGIHLYKIILSGYKRLITLNDPDCNWIPARALASPSSPPNGGSVLRCLLRSQRASRIYLRRLKILRSLLRRSSITNPKRIINLLNDRALSVVFSEEDAIG